MPADPLSGEDTPPGLYMAVFSLFPHMTESRERSRLSDASSYKSTNFLMRAPPSLPNYVLKALSPNTITPEIRISAREFWEGHIQSIATIHKGLH